jgi:hypothetical protein
MRPRWYVVALVLALSAPAHAERLPWYRGFYARAGLRDSYGVYERLHAWAAVSYGVGYRFDRELWGIDVSAFNLQYDPEEGMHTIGRIVPYIDLGRWTRAHVWLGAGLSYGWVKGTVDEAIAKRRGEGWQAEGILGVELPRALRIRLFAQLAFTAPLYYLHDTIYDARDSALYAVAAEAALGVRF